MAAILGNRQRRRSGVTTVNHRIEIDGKRYRVCVSSGGHVLLVALKSRKESGGFERYLAIDGRRARRIIHATACSIIAAGLAGETGS